MRFSTDRLQAFSDGVFAILITIMVLSLRLPSGQSWSALGGRGVVGSLLLYLLSFTFLGIYWVNHHHMMSLCERVTGAMLWSNLALLFALSLIPFVTRWAGIGTDPPYGAPLTAYAIVSLLAACTYTVLQMTIIRAQGEGSPLAEAIGADYKGKISVLGYVTALATGIAGLPWVTIGFLIAVAAIWLVPDPRIERRVTG